MNILLLAPAVCLAFTTHEWRGLFRARDLCLYRHYLGHERLLRKETAGNQAKDYPAYRNQRMDLLRRCGNRRSKLMGAPVLKQLTTSEKRC